MSIQPVERKAEEHLINSTPVLGREREREISLFCGTESDGIQSTTINVAQGPRRFIHEDAISVTESDFIFNSQPADKNTL